LFWAIIVERVERTNVPGATTSGLKRLSFVGPRLEKGTTSFGSSASGSERNGATGKSVGHQAPYISALKFGRRFSQAPTVMQFFAVPGADTLMGLIFPSPSSSVPSLPEATTTQKSLCSQTNRSRASHCSS
jgi:hypothetical protein